MVTNHEVYGLIRIIWNLSMLKHEAVIAEYDLGKIRVKGEKGLKSLLEPIIDFFEAYKKPETSDMLAQMKKWDETFETEYLESHDSDFMAVIGSGFAKELANDCDSWFITIYAIYEKSPTPLAQEEITKIIKSLLSHIDSQTICDDLKDVHSCITNELFTPAAMLLQKVAEGMVKEFYKKKLGEYPPSEYDST